MAIPTLYWMLECSGCHCRFVVYDSYLVFLGTDRPDPQPGDGYGGPPLPMRYSCVRGCADTLHAVGSIHQLDDTQMRLNIPSMSMEMPEHLEKEWRYLLADPTRWVLTPFPYEMFRAEYARRFPVLIMTDHDGTRQTLPPLEAVLRWFEVMEHGNTLSLVRRDGSTIDIRHDGRTYRVRLVSEPNTLGALANLTADGAMERLARYFSGA